MGRPLVVRKKTFIRTSKHELTKTLSLLNKESQAAIEILVKLLESQDEKVKLAAAKELLGFQSSISEQINRDALQRLIAEIKFNPSGGNGDLEDDTPQIDFDTVQEIE